MKHLLTIISLLVTQQLMAQQDCVYAITVCSMDTLSYSTGFAGVGYYDELAPNSTCFINGESNSVWFQFSIDQPGTLVFSIAPEDSTQDDYDFILFKAGSNGCANISSSSVRCSFAGNPGLPSGLRAGATDTTATVSGSAWLAPVNALSGEHYYLLIDNYISARDGFTLTFDGSTASFGDLDSTVINTAVSYDSLQNTISLGLTTYIDLSSFSSDNSEFSLTGPNGAVPIANITCQNPSVSGNDTFCSQFLLSLTNPLDTGAYYTVEIVTGTDGNSFTSYCSLQMAYTIDSFYVSAADTIPDDTTGISPVPQFSDLVQMYPNPAKDVLYIKADIPNGTMWSASLFDLNGKQISTAKVSTQSHQMDLGAMPNGTYLLLCRSAFGTYQQKVVVLH